MKKLLLFIPCLIMALISCDDTTDTLGSSLTDVNDTMHIETAEYAVTSQSVRATNLVSRATTGYLGKIKDPETGLYIAGNYMTQFRPLMEDQFESLEDVYVEDYDPSQPKWSQVECDSCAIMLYLPKWYGDSLTQMKFTLHELSKPYEEGVPYTSDFDPLEEGYVRTEAGSIHKQLSYSLANLAYSLHDRLSDEYDNNVAITLNEPYTDRDGVTYNNYGTYIMRKYFNPATSKNFNQQYLFNHNICPGFYFQTSGGLGNMATVDGASLLVFYSVKDDTLYHALANFGATEEVLQMTNILLESDKMDELVNDNSCTYLKTPAGIFTEMTLPVDEVITKKHANDTLSTARLFIPRINNTYQSEYSLNIPQTLLLVEKDSVESFFNKQKLADYRSSYLSTYSSTYNGYSFGNISYLVSSMYRKRNASGLSNEEYAALHPNWNKVMLIPVETTYTTLSSSSELTKVTYDMSLTSTKLAKGTEDNGKITLKVIYSKFSE
ncbi:MAG: DUF4270 domain-containing protein [Prevotella sp.]|jgi:hypothetical protein|nr:DUF4270 domain-containing protein [Prevotella sp.]